MPETSSSTSPGHRRGYRPKQPIAPLPLYRWPPQPVAVVKWLLHFLGDLWVVFYLCIAFLLWTFFTPTFERMESFSAGWVAALLARNLALLVLFVGAWHRRFYVKKAQGTDYKYNDEWPATDNPIFFFRDQVWDNVFWNVCSGVPIWTAYEAVTFWLQANGIVPTVSWQARPTYCVTLVLLTPAWISIHFYVIHRLLHWEPLYKAVHRFHHKNSNPGPWSGVAMHPIEHLLYFSAVGLFWFVPAHPIHVLYLLLHLSISPAVGHLGFDRFVVTKRISFRIDGYLHYLHHKCVQANYGDEWVPFDRWFGTFFDGSDEGMAAIRKRALERMLRSRKSKSQ